MGMYGYIGKMLFVNLSTGAMEERELSRELAKDYIGGPALGARILYEEMPAHADVFGPESMVGFISGPLNGTGAFFGGRYTVVSKSPVYNGWNDANSGGSFGPMLKKAGYDAVFVKGIAEKPVYLWIDNGHVEIRDASNIWGMMVVEAEKALYKELSDDRVGAALIGPAGEKCSYMAAVMNDGHRAAGRGGTGAVMGSKKLKAVVCRGKHEVKVADKEKLIATNKTIADFIKNGPMAKPIGGIGTYGTGIGFMPSVLSGDASIRNWTSALEATSFTEEDMIKLSPLKMDERFKVKRFGCSTCPLRCGAIYKVEEGKWPLEETGRPEYESIGAFGNQVLCDDPLAMIKCNDLCNVYGMDTISVGGTLGWAVECFNEGLLSKEQLDGLTPYWGDAEAMVALTEKICKMEGCGKILGMGSKYAADHYGVGHEFLFVASGIEIAQHDPRLSPGYIRTYELDPTPGRHVKGGLAKFNNHQTREEKYSFKDTGFEDVREVVSTEFMNNSGLCVFSIRCVPPGAHIKLVEAVTGIPMTMKYVHELGVRSFTQRHAFNLREGLRRKNFYVTDRMKGIPPLSVGPLKGITLDAEKLGDSFYIAMGYYLDGVPHRDMLKLTGGLEHVLKDLYPDQSDIPAAMAQSLAASNQATDLKNREHSK